MPYTTIEGVEIFYEIKGRGEVVVLMHHGFGSSAMWKAIAPGLVRVGYRVLMYDRRGFGLSGAGQHFAEYYVSGSFREKCLLELERLLDRLGIQAAHLLGQCEGGVIALDYALLRPKRVKSVITSSTQCFSDIPMTELNRMMFPASFSELKAETRAKLCAWHGEKRARTLYDQCRQYGGAYGKGVFDLRDMLAEVACQVLILYPDRSSLFAVEQGVAFYRHLQRSELAVLPGCGHNTYEQQPGEYLRQVIGFLQKRVHNPA
ncbi:MAG: alpha/beta fold hydrolase [Thermodesulfobacteriota bacterium]